MLVLRVEFLRGVFEGGQADGPEQPEWPPSWMRLFSALVASAELDEDAGLLERIEQLPRPEILASSAIHQDQRGSFVPTNALNAKWATTTLVGRTNNERWWGRTFPREPVVEYVWPEESLGASDVERLKGIARRIPYVGRASSPVVVSVADERPSKEEGLLRLLPYRDDAPGLFTSKARLRSPFPGSLDALRRAFDAKHEGGSGDPWQIGEWDEYGVFDPSGVAPVPSPYGDMVIFRIVGARLDGRNTAALARATRRALMARVGDTPIAQLHGHDEGSSLRQIAILGLPDVGHRHADGHLLGIAVCLPDMGDRDLLRLARALPAPGARIEVKAGKLGVIELEREDPTRSDKARARGLHPDRWSGAPRGSKVWATVLPLVADRFLDRDEPIEPEIARVIDHSGYLPLARLIRTSRRPMVLGGIDLRPRDTLRRHDDRAVRPYFHAMFELERPVLGPVVIGSMRHYGLGLCAPAEGTLTRDDG
jgi:CRISPR-associated protein Csb2